MKTNPILSTTVAALLALTTVPAISQATNYNSNTTISGTVTDTSVAINSNAIVEVVAGGTWNASGNFYINNNSSSNSTVLVNGGILNYAGGGGDGFQVGWYYGGNFNISAGEANFSSVLRMYNGDINISGGTLNLLSNNLQVGEYGDSLFNSVSISGGTANIRGIQYDGGGGASGQYNVALSGTGTLSIGSYGIDAGSGKPGSLNFSGGTLNLGNVGAIRRSFGTNGIFDIVDHLFIGGVPQPAGVWGGVGSGAANETSLIQNGDTLTVLSTVPEPSAMLLSGSSLIGLLALRRRRE